MPIIGPAAGHLSFLLLSISVALGLVSRKPWLGQLATGRIAEAQQWAGASAVLAAMPHALLLVHRPMRPPGWLSLLLPSLSGREGWLLTLGIYGLYTYLIVALGWYLLRAIKACLRRWVPWLSYPVWALSLVHVVLFTRGFRPWEVALYGGMAAVVLLLCVPARLFAVRKRKAPTAPAQ
jgi:methionine sulfoxide reductase heme-binding subunit